ncbi:MAG TPA: bifunctional hydroxymethylpyrimidine kinase/phosphomethylpyrimidine kinase [Chthoniobacteraceae bacterium]|nr:bifunctional hydroxymethylpyrimidine kinase/phosphomethylpyrimidine kinase [Chthoniobacteraceae bacterium]
MSSSVALTIAGSDNSAGAGAQADLKTMSALGVYGLTAITCVVAEVPGKVSRVQAIDAAVIAEQIRLSWEAFPIAAVKTGMLFSRSIIETVCDALLPPLREKNGPRPFLVVDPVMIASSGDPLLSRDAVQTYCERLFPLADLLTPNLEEAATLLCQKKIATVDEMRSAGRELLRRFGVALLMKGGHLADKDAAALDLLFTKDGAVHEFSAPFVRDVDTHGTGCTYAAAITAYLARGAELVEAVREAKRFVTAAITNHHRWRRGAHGTTDALDHFAEGKGKIGPSF